MALGFADMIDSLRHAVQNWNITEWVRYSLPDGLYCAAYILIIDAVWHNDNRIIKYFIISIVPVITIVSEILQYFELVKGTFDIYDLVCYSLPTFIYITYKLCTHLMNTNSNLIRSFLSICVITIFIIGITASSEAPKSTESQYTEKNATRVSDSFNKTKQSADNIINKAIYSIKDIDELHQAINNTVWTHTTRGDVWLRFEFVGNVVKQYGALPADGEWRYDGDSEYTLSEHRSQSDGKRYIIATFYPKTKSLAMFELPVVFNFWDYHLYLNGEDMGGFIKTDYVWE